MITPTKCDGCGAGEDSVVLDFLDCQPAVSGRRWKRVCICAQCWQKLDPDQWIGQGCWEAIAPVVPFDDLPDLVHPK